MFCAILPTAYRDEIEAFLSKLALLMGDRIDVYAFEKLEADIPAHFSMFIQSQVFARQSVQEAFEVEARHSIYEELDMYLVWRRLHHRNVWPWCRAISDILEDQKYAHENPGEPDFYDNEDIPYTPSTPLHLQEDHIIDSMFKSL